MKLHKLLIILVLINIIFSCKSYNNSYNVSGKYYINKNFNLLDYLLLRKRRMSDSISVNKDSSYYYSGCVIAETGYWKVKKNKLYLFCKKRKYKVDSLKNILEIDTLTCNIPVKVFKIKKNKLIKTIGLRTIIEFIKIK